jgi:membrane associated rhomboid family serine protease
LITVLAFDEQKADQQDIQDQNIEPSCSFWGEQVKGNVGIALACLALLWVVFVIDTLLPIDLHVYGIRPRSVDGLVGLAAAPFLHGGLGHLISNSIALFPLLCASLAYSRIFTLEVAFITALVGGGFTWVFGAGNTVHIGASGVVFGLIGYLLTIGLFRRDLLALVISLMVSIYYGWAFFSLFIVLPGISWSGHFFGFLSGVFAAWLSKRIEATTA